MSSYTSRHLIAAHRLIERLNQNPRVHLEQVDGKDLIAEALADAERGVFIAARASEPQGAPSCIVVDIAAAKPFK